VFSFLRMGEKAFELAQILIGQVRGRVQMF